MKKTKLKINKKIFYRRIGSLLLLVVAVSSIFVLFKKTSKGDYYKPKSRVKSVSTYKIEDAKTLGWIQVQGTNIDYPVIDETNDAYSSGIDYLWRVNTYTEGSNREAIYGHNIRNVSSEPLITNENHTRFEQLMSFVYYDFAKENLYVNYTYDGKDHLYKIYAAGFVSTYDESGDDYDEDKYVDSYIKKAKKNSIYDYKVDVDSSDHIISLITCTRYFGKDEKNQFRIDAREVRKNENISKYSVEKNSNYDIIK